MLNDTHHAGAARKEGHAKAARNHPHHLSAVVKNGVFDIHEARTGAKYWMGELRANRKHIGLFEQKTPSPGVHVLQLMRKDGPAPADSPFDLDVIEREVDHWFGALEAGQSKPLLADEDPIEHSNDDLLTFVRQDNN